MSPLARSLLALACAALLRAAFAQDHPTKCSTDKKGKLYGLEIKLPEIKIPTIYGPVVDFEILDNCDIFHDRLLQGEIAEACDYNAAPTVVIYDHFKKVRVTRNYFTYDEPDATLQVYQYCA